jgi:hypothetical protein
MAIALSIIAVIFLLGYRAYSDAQTKKSGATDLNSDQILPASVECKSEENIEILTDENGLSYQNVTTTVEIPRRTYLHGTLSGKYWGEIDKIKKGEFETQKFYDFNIYECEITIANHAGVSQSPFRFTPDDSFPRERLPQTIPCRVNIDGSSDTYSVALHEPLLKSVSFNRQLHQSDGDEVFGTIEAEITGFILDFKKETKVERVYVAENIPNPANVAAQKEREFTETLVPTGNVEYNNGYKRTEYYYSDYKNVYWGKWQYDSRKKTPLFDGCLPTMAGLFGLVAGCIFLLFAIPQLGILLPIMLFPLLLRLMSRRILDYLLRFFAIILFASFVVSLFIALSSIFERSTINPEVVREEEREKRVIEEPTESATNRNGTPDTLIKRFREWRSYDDTYYSGWYSIRKQDFLNAKSFKNNLTITANDADGYDRVIYLIKENDKTYLGGIYHMFDSLQRAKKLTKMAFAEMIVSFVQDIPYALVLPYDCNPEHYSDNFIRSYLKRPRSKCDGYEKYGINSPIEFLATLNGDCDTRTLLLYTILSKYGYDVVLLSSEYYNHSLLGVNLPYSGTKYTFLNQHYSVWETTAPNVQPGLLSKEISNMNYWRISLKSN